jgi:hypothetical protein
MSLLAYDRAIDTKEGQAPYDQPFNMSMYPAMMNAWGGEQRPRSYEGTAARRKMQRAKAKHRTDIKCNKEVDEWTKQGHAGKTSVHAMLSPLDEYPNSPCIGTDTTARFSHHPPAASVDAAHTLATVWRHGPSFNSTHRHHRISTPPLARAQCTCHTHVS